MTKEKNDMTNEHNFKAGDKVRVKCTDIEDIVIDVCNGNAFLKKGGYWNVKTLELVESLDRRTAFLTRLQSLMREFDAEIIFHCDYKQETLATSIIIGESEIRRNEVYGVTADNIMDFDKE
ncbi:MAG: hypothetical protein HDT08_04170 [Bacteroidales bacterium]|nr:hypothetical protein [Bacteroidales bacterium]